MHFLGYLIIRWMLWPLALCARLEAMALCARLEALALCARLEALALCAMLGPFYGNIKGSEKPQSHTRHS